MREFGSGILGCIICVIALMGSILGGFCLDVDKETRESTNYNYTTDITGLFDTIEAPKYIDYNPSTNFTGYTEQSVRYVNSSIPNNYRYVADSGLTSTLTFNNTFNPTNTSQMVPAPDGGNLNVPYFINYTGTRYNLGTSTTWNGITYNMMADVQNEYPCITTLYDVFNDRGLTNGDYNLLDSGYPVIIYNGSFTSSIAQLYDSIRNITCRSITIDDTSFPTKISYTYPNVTAYNGSTQLWTANVGNVYVIYDYGIMVGGTYTQVSVNTDFNYYLNGTFTKTDTSFTSAWVPDTHYVFTNYQNLYIYNTDYDFGEVRQFTQNVGSRYNATLVKDPGGTNFCATPIYSILQSLYGSNIPVNTWLTIDIENNGNPFFIRNVTSTGTHTTTDAVMGTTNWDVDQIRITTSGDFTNYYGIMLYKNGTRLANADGRDYAIMWGYTPNNQAAPNINTTFSVRVGADGNVGSGDSYTFPSNLSSGTYGPLVAFNYTGTTLSYNFGTAVTDHGLTYNGRIITFYNTSGGQTTGPYLGAYRLSDLLDTLDIENSISANVEITQGSLPVFFMHNQQWTETSVALGNTVNKGYATIFTDDNLPTRFTWNTQTNWVTMYRANTLLYSDSAANIIVTRDCNVVSGGGWQFSTIGLDGIINKSGTTIAGLPTVTYESDYPVNSTKFPYVVPDDPNGSALAAAHINLINTSYNLDSVSILGLPSYNIVSQQYVIETNRAVPDITRFSDIISSVDFGDNETATFNLNQTGSYPVLFYTGPWQQITTLTGEHTITYYCATMDEGNIPDKIVYSCITGSVKIYKNNTLINESTADKIDVIYNYNVKPQGETFTDAQTSCTITGVGTPPMRYAYMDPTKGVTLNRSSTLWQNGYENNDIDIILTRERDNTTNELIITAGTSSITVRTVGNTMSAYVTKYDGTTVSKTIGTWVTCQIHINASEGTVSLTPSMGFVNYTNSIPENSTTTTWTGWYNGGDISSLIISSTQQSMRFSITNTTVFLRTYGVVMQDPSINVLSYFPEYEDWRLNFYSFALVGDSMTVNGQTIPVNDDQKITVTGDDGNTITGTLSNVYVTEKDDHMYFTFVDSKETVDLGETTDTNISFTGRWYFTTGLYEGVDSTEDYYDWNLDGRLHATMPQMCLFFIGILIAGLVICKALLRIEIGAIDWIILIFATVISLIIAGGSL